MFWFNKRTENQSRLRDGFTLLQTSISLRPHVFVILSGVCRFVRFSLPSSPAPRPRPLTPTSLAYISLHLLTFFSVPSAAYLSVPLIVRACARCQQKVKSSTLGTKPLLISKDKSGGAVSPLKVQQATAARRLLRCHETSEFGKFQKFRAKNKNAEICFFTVRDYTPSNLNDF